MNLYGATVYVRLDGDDERLKNMMNPKHKNYSKIPEELISLRAEIQKKYNSIVPIDFRYFYALKAFEMMTILNHYEDAIDLVLELEDSLKTLNYKVMITAGFGTVALPKKFQEMKPSVVLHQVLGHGVYSAFEYFKRKKEQLKKEYTYYFYSFHHNFTHFNVKRTTLEKRKETLKQELCDLQQIDEQTQRHTYYPNYEFKN